MSDEDPSLDALVDAVRGEGAPTADDRARVRRKLATKLGAAAFVTTTTVGAMSAGKVAGVVSAGAARFLAGVALVAAAGGGFVALRTAGPSPRVATSAHRPPPVTARRVTSLAAPAPAAAVAEVPTAVGATLAPPPPRPRAAPPPRGADAPTTTSITAEVNALRDARRAMTEGDPERALAILDAQERAGSVGALRVERFAARLIAQCRLGRARDLDLRSFYFHHGASPLAQGVTDACRR